MMYDLKATGADLKKVLCATSMENLPHELSEIKTIPAILNDRLDITDEALSST